MFRTALRNVLAHKARLLMTVLAVMLGVAFVSGTLVFTSTISDAFRTSSQKSFDHVDVALTPPSPDGPPGTRTKDPRLDGKTLDTVSRLPGTASVTGTVDGFTGIGDKDGKLIGSGGSRGSNYFPGKDGKDARYPLKQGTAPTGADQFALDAGTAAKGGYHVGDTVRISADGPVRQQKLTGIFTTDDGRVAAGGSLALFDTRTAQQLFGLSGGYSQIDVEAAAGTSQAALQQAIGKALPKDSATTITGKELADLEAKAIDHDMEGMKTALLAFAAVALFVGIFLIANTFTMLVVQRTKELALMRAVGASRRQVTRSVLIEAFFVGAIAGVSGLAAGIGIAAVLREVLNGFVAKFPEGPLVVSPSTAVAALGIGIVITVLAAWLPARRGAKVPPVAAMNSVHAVATTKSLLVRNILGALVAGIGTASVVVATSVYEGDDTSKIMLGGGGMLLLVGVFILTPLLSRPLIALATPVLRAFGISGLLARQNALRNPRRTATTASALMIGLTLITGMTVIAGSTQKGIDKMAVDALKADYTVSMQGNTRLPTTAEKAVRDVPGVTALTPLRVGMATIGTGSAARQPTELTGVDGAQFGSLVRLDISEGSLGTLRGDRVLVDEGTADRNSWRAGSRLPVTFEDGKKATLTVSGVFKGNEMLNGVFLDNRTLAPHQKDISDKQLLVKLSGGATDAHKDDLIEALGKNPAVTVADKKDVSNAIASMFTLLLNMLYGLLAMAVIVAVLGVINTLAMSVFERSQEIGMLRAIGLDRRGIKRMVRLESLVISLFGGVLGVGLGVFMGWAVGQLIGAHLPTYELVLPWARMGLFLGLAALVGVLAALWPAFRAARLNMLAAIKAE
ncbi:ABC transporter permease [Streptomyces hygroscopicus]|uniref:ABC transporter permease n=1 Tax=Streptomyces hygroscopicus TaxID=1912 RepID=UPI001FCB421B|nr:ABC transporter permease [Streptomyces hygroscopicus]BDH09641.1 ABC transporter [Streptomyces hygroscopicus]